MRPGSVNSVIITVMQAAILAVGSELLGTDRLDTNSLRITESLRRFGAELRRKSVVGDDVGELAAEVSYALAQCDLLVITGGIGPTTDDVTREAVASALGRPLVCQEWIVDEIRAKFAGFGREMPESNRKQADVIEGAMVLANPRGTAPGQRIEAGGRTLFLLPGVPREVEGLIAKDLEPWLEERFAGQAMETRCLRVACVPESTLEQLIAPYYEEYGSEGLSVLSQPGEILLQVSVAGASSEVERQLGARTGRLTELLGDAIFTDDVAGTLELIVGQLLAERRLTVVTAESCTGGLVAERLTRVPGSSVYFQGSTIAYSYELKTELLGVPSEMLERFGAVSREVVSAMAIGGRSRMAGDYCIAISGVAGPGGATDQKPVGTVDLAVAGPEDRVRHLKAQFPGDRQRVREQASQWGLDMLRRWLVDASEPHAAHLAPTLEVAAPS